MSDGQLGFNEGGWVQPDEGATDYLGRINQATLGQEWLADRLGVYPTAGWRKTLVLWRPTLHSTASHPQL